ncbi:MAG: hypothetical protein ACUVQ9_13405 [Thermodesulfobacteriota bacterium]
MRILSFNEILRNGLREMTVLPILSLNGEVVSMGIPTPKEAVWAIK